MINQKALVLQMTNLYKRQGGMALFVYLAKAFNYLVINKYFKGSNSQKGEDLVISSFFNHKKNGFYIDIGAFHPTRYNNTKYFYDKGWCGINIEPNPNRSKLFKIARPRDINLNIGIGIKTGKEKFYEFQSEALSTFSTKESEALMEVGYVLKRKSNIQMHTLKSIMNKYINSKKKIDFMTVDTEGLDMDVLKSNDWNKYRPSLICVETIDFIDQLNEHLEERIDRKVSISNYLLSKGYQEYHSNGLNTIYKDNSKNI